MTENSSTGRRFLVIAPIGRDATSICRLLKASGFLADRLTSLQRVERIPFAQLLGLVLTDEALAKGGIDALRRIVQAQPSWSNIPVLLLSTAAGEPDASSASLKIRSEIRNLVLLDHPLRSEIFLSAARAAGRARLQQIEIRDAAELQAKSNAALRNSEKLAATGRLVATIAHEVNNPLAALGNLLYLVEISNSLQEAQSFGRLAAHELGRISEIIDHTLNFNRTSTQPAFTDLAEVAASALSLFRGKMKERNITANIASEQAGAFCSPGEIRQALVNLIGNAIDAMPVGGCLRVRVTPISINRTDFARITIADNGTGIPCEIRSNLFSQFFTTKGSRGTGLGLWLTRDIVQRNSGKLHLRSRTKTPSGTTFVIYLPAAPGAGQLARSPEKTLAAAS
ncbi:MAG: HAMP domain-containing sensor histidine kinase [Terracidiphilus sp.]